MGRTMRQLFFHSRRLIMSYGIEGLLRYSAWAIGRKKHQSSESAPAYQLPDMPQSPEDFRPLEHACFQNPYGFYQMLRNDYPVYQLANGIFCVSRFEDIAAVSRDHDTFSSTYQGAVAGLGRGRSIIREGEKIALLGRLGIVPSDVLALSDPPVHTGERKVGHKALNARFVKGLEENVAVLCRTMMDEFIDDGEIEFMQDFAWKLPMRLIIELLGFPAEDFEKIKAWCVHGIRTQSGIATSAELAISRAEMMVFFRYCWRQYLQAKKHPRHDLSAIFVAAAADRNNPMSDQVAVSAILQLLIAGSDSSATSMGNALKMLIENPKIQQELREDSQKIPAFIEEVFRLEAAFQGHFRWTKKDTELHGVALPAESRIFLMWASGNRDERMFEQPDSIDLQRKNGKKHLTFGHGIHACIGRELARTEIRIVVAEFLRRTNNLRLVGDAPFIASMFAHTLQKLPLAFDPILDVDAHVDLEQRRAV